MKQRSTVDRVAWLGVVVAVCMVLVGFPAAAQQDPPCGTVAASAMSTGDFDDVPPGNPFFAAVNGAVGAEVMSGCGGDYFCPGEPVTREDAAVFLEKGIQRRGVHPLTAALPAFSDVSSTYCLQGWIAQAVQDAVMPACAAGRFCAFTPLTRADFVKHLALSLAYPLPDASIPSTGSGYDCTTGSPAIFNDATTGATCRYASYVQGKLAGRLDLRALDGCPAGLLCPAWTTRRDVAAAMLWAAFPQVTPPAIGSIAPSTGPTTGGTSVTVTGSGFVQQPTTTRVYFGATAAQSVTFVDATTLTAVSPAGSGSVAAYAVNPDGGFATAPTSFGYGQEYTLTVTRTAGGGVTSNPAGIDCGTTCAAGFSSSTTVTLTPTADAGYTFSGWSGACSGAGTCAVAMSSDKAVHATFTQALPGGFTLVSPANGQTGLGTSVNLSWTPSSGATSYEVYLGTAEPLGLLQTVTGTGLGVTVAAGNTYYWRIAATNAAGWTYSPTVGASAFTTSASAPEPPSLEYPLDGAEELGNLVTLRWEPSAGASTYDVHLYSDQTNDLFSGLTAVSHQVTLEYARTYYWYIVAWNGSGGASQSLTRHFHTQLQQSFSISGRVMSGGAPYPGVLVSATYIMENPDSPDSFQWHGETDGNGDYTIFVPNAGPYQLRPSHAECPSFSITGAWENPVSVNSGHPAVSNADFAGVCGPFGSPVDTPGVFDDSSGTPTWTLRNSNSGGPPDRTLYFGLAGDKPLAGDWNGDGVATVGVYREATRTFLLRNSNTDGPADLVVHLTTPGNRGNVPLVGDWNGDGTDTVGLYDSANAWWDLRDSNTDGGPTSSFQYGPGGSSPVVGDWDGTGTDTIGVFLSGSQEWRLRNENSPGSPNLTFQYGEGAGLNYPIAGDWNGDGTDTIGIFRKDDENPTWRLRNINAAGPPDVTFPYGATGVRPAPGHWGELPEIGSISGRVTVEGGAGLAGVSVVAYVESSERGQATTSTDGTYTIGALGLVQHTVTPSMAGCTFQPTSRISTPPATGVDFVVTCPPPPDTTPPAWPAGAAVTATGIASTSLTLNWPAATDAVGVTGYRVAAGKRSWTLVGNVLSANLTGLNPWQSYNCKVEARDAAGNWSPTLVAPITVAPRVDTVGVYRPGAFLLRNFHAAGPADLSVTFGQTADIPVAGDWDGNGTQTVGYFRPGNATFYLKNSNAGVDPDIVVAFGASTDLPVIGDWDGNGTDTIGVYRPASHPNPAAFFLRNSNTPGAPDLSFTYGPEGATPVIGDWNADRIDTIGVYAGGYFYLRNTNNAGAADLMFPYGAPGEGDIPVAGDWDGNDRDTIGVFRASSADWLLRKTNDAGPADIAFQYGLPTDRPVVGHWAPPPANPPAPTAVAISPASGCTAGGTPVTVTGTNFLNIATLSIGGVPAQGVTVANATTILATTGAHAAGAADVVVTNMDAKTGMLSGGFTYVAGDATFVLDRSTLRFGGTNAGALRTSGQAVRVSVGGTGQVAWTASSDRGYIQVFPSNGSGNGEFTVSIAPGTAASGTGTVTVTAQGVCNGPRTVAVSYTAYPAGQSAAPFGNFEAPPDNSTGVVGALPVTGWALDDIEATRVDVWRDPQTGEPVHPNGHVYVGDAAFVPGIRPDVEAAYPNHPLAYRGAWGYSLLTNLLPGGGNGPYRLHVYVHDAEGHSTYLGARQITCNNSNSTKPFGTIDTPAQGGVASGTSYVSYGWALTPQPGSIPIDGSTITVLIDGVGAGHPVYNTYRSDIATLFPGYANSNAAGGRFTFDTTTLANGTHTIMWSVTDSLGRSEGIGSRYFTVQNPPSTAPAARFYTLTPCRVYDTRESSGPYAAAPALQPGARRDFVLAGTCGIPVDASSVSANITVIPTASGQLRLTPGNQGLTTAIAISLKAGRVLSNNALIVLATDGSGTFGVQNDAVGTVHFILDVNGYYR